MQIRNEHSAILHDNSAIYSSYALLNNAVAVFEIALPILAINLSATTNNFSGASIASNIGDPTFSGAASSIIFPVQVSLIVIFSAPLFAIPVIMQKYIENKDDILIGQTIMQGMKLSILLSCVPSILSFYCKNIFNQLGTPNEITSLIGDYFDVFGWVLPTQLLAFSMQQATIGLNRTNLLIGISALNTLCTVVPGYIISNGLFGLITSSNSGVAYGFLIGGVLRIGVCGYYFYKGDFEQYNIYSLENMRNNKILKDIWQMGWPFGLQLVSEFFAINMLAVIVNYFPNKVYSLDILNAMNQYNLFSVIVPIGLSEASAILISRACERRDYSEVRKLGNSNLLMGLTFNLMLVLLGLIIPNQLLSFFMDPFLISGKGLNGNLRALFFIVLLGLTFNSARDIVTGSLRPLGIVKAPMYASYIAVCIIGLTLAAILSIPLKLGVGGVLLGYYLGVSIGSMYMLRKWDLISKAEIVESIINGNISSSDSQQSCNDFCTFFKNRSLAQYTTISDQEMIAQQSL